MLANLRMHVRVNTCMRNYFSKINKKEKEHHLHCAKMCKNIYNSPEDVVIQHHNNTLYIAIEGTDSFSNWVDNISVVFKSNDIHRGFRRYTDKCVSKYNPLNEIQKYENITICGHSLGSACAVLLAYQLCQEYKQRNEIIKSNIDLVVFGCPKVGGQSFHEEFNTICTDVGLGVVHYRNNSDYICDIPFGFLGYYNTFNEEDTRLMDTSESEFWDVSKHYMQSYIESIEQIETYEE